MTRIERRVFRNSVLVGMLVTLCVLLAQVMGWLQSPENWVYDLRARKFQFHSTPPTDKLIHVDIDDGALEAVGRWPWPRQQMAEMIDEMRLAGAKAIGLDILYPDPQSVDHVVQTDPSGQKIVGEIVDHDGLFAAALRRAGNVIVPVSMPLRPIETDKLKEAVIQQLAADLELTEAELVARVGVEGFRDGDVPARVKALLIPQRREAAYRRIRREMATKDLTADQLRAAILRRTDVSISSPLTRVIDEQLERYRQVQAALALGGPVQHAAPLLANVDVHLAPVASLSQASAGTAIVDFQPSSDGILRSMPLIVNGEGKLFPVLGLGLALQYMGVPLADLKFDGKHVTVPQPGAASIRIPVRTIYSANLGRPVPATFDVPWFGSSHWETMYDWPGHQQVRQHISMKAVWEPCLVRRKVVTNNRTLDRATTAFAEVLGIKPPAVTIAADDFEGRLARLQLLQKDEMFQAWRDQYRAMKPEELDKDGKAFLAATADIDAIRSEGMKLQQDLRNARAALLSHVQGKALLVGFTATGNQDAVATSLHGACPGVVAHGAVFNAILTGNFWTAVPGWVNLLVTAILGVATALIAGRLSWQMAFLVVAAMAATVILFNGLYVFDTLDRLADLASPLIAMTSVWIACSVVRIYMETIERKRVERRFRSYVDPDIVNAYMERGDAATAGESRELTVAFTDLAGFTTLSERLGEKTVPMLNDYLDRMVPLIYEKHGIMKFLGDGIMFFYGAPKPNPDHAVDAVLTALQMQKALAAFNEDLAAKNLPQLSLRIGINTGLMVVGDAGSRDPIQRHEYTVLGDAVNFASRLEGANKYTGTHILISARTAQLCGDKFLLRPVGAIQVAGKVEAVLCFEVCGLADAADDVQRNLCAHTRELVEQFRGRQFETVLKLADQLDRTHGPSKLTSIYRDLAESYLTNPPEQSFDGRIEFEAK